MPSVFWAFFEKIASIFGLPIPFKIHMFIKETYTCTPDFLEAAREFKISLESERPLAASERADTSSSSEPDKRAGQLITPPKQLFPSSSGDDPEQARLFAANNKIHELDTPGYEFDRRHSTPLHKGQAKPSAAAVTSPADPRDSTVPGGPHSAWLEQPASTTAASHDEVATTGSLAITNLLLKEQRMAAVTSPSVLCQRPAAPLVPSESPTTNRMLNFNSVNARLPKDDAVPDFPPPPSSAANIKVELIKSKLLLHLVVFLL